MLYILDDQNNPKEIDEMKKWDEWMCSHEDKVTVGKDCFNDITVSTVFLGVGAVKGGEFPKLFESVIYEEGDIVEVKRYADYKEAKENHVNLVKKFNSN